MYPDKDAEVGTMLLEIRGLSDGSGFADIDLSVRAGEIIGLTGIIGSGREELVDTIYGIRKARRGTVEIDGDPTKLRSPAHAVQSGLVLVPRDRRNDGLVLDMSVGDNINVATLDMVSSKLGWLFRGQARDRSDELVEQLDVRPRAIGHHRPVPERRQPAEGGAGSMAGHRIQGFRARQPDSRGRRGRSQRDLCVDRPACRGRLRGHHLLE